jgi:hypothetical protein
MGRDERIGCKDYFIRRTGWFKLFNICEYIRCSRSIPELSINRDHTDWTSFLHPKLSVNDTDQDCRNSSSNRGHFLFWNNGFFWLTLSSNPSGRNLDMDGGNSRKNI